MKENTETVVLWAYVAFFIGVAVGLLMLEQPVRTLFVVVTPALATLIAAYVGAKYAFALQNNRQAEQEKRHRVAASNKVIFALARMRSQLLDFKQQFIEPVEDSDAPYLEMLPALGLRDDVTVDFDSISFLLQSEHRNLLGQLSMVAIAYQSIIGAINSRSKLHAEQIQPKLEAIGVTKGKTYIVDQIKDALGERLFETIKSMTNQIIAYTNEDIKRIETISAELTTAFRDMFPGAEIIALGPPAPQAT